MVLFTKYSNERSRRFRIRTDILEENGARHIRKTALTPEASGHIAHIYECFLRLSRDLAGTPLTVNECTLRADGTPKDGPSGAFCRFPYREGRTLEEKLDELLQHHRAGEVKDQIRSYFGAFSDCSREFAQSPEFAEVFGEVSFARPQKCREVSDIDMVFSNVIGTPEGWELIDYEWTFLFPVPLRFIQYRCLHYYILGNAARARLGLDERQLMEEFDISEDEQRQFAAMEQRFQQYILGGYCPIWKQYDDISDGVIDVAPLVREESRRRKCHPAVVCFDTGDGFTEKGRREYGMTQADGASFEIWLPEGTRALRLEPYSARCLVRIVELSQAGRPLPWTCNGAQADNGDLIFDTDTPQIEIRTGQEGPVRVSFRAEPLGGIARELILNQHGRIRWMEQTKVWRLYRKLKGGEQI